MKIILDECVPYNLLRDLRARGVRQLFSVRMMGWDGVKNGDLIKRADEIFDVFITIDKNLKYQQNLSRARMAIILLSVQNNRVATIVGKSQIIIDCLDKLIPGQFLEI